MNTDLLHYTWFLFRESNEEWDMKNVKNGHRPFAKVIQQIDDIILHILLITS